MSPDGTRIVFRSSRTGIADLGRKSHLAADARFLINALLTEAAAPITRLQNWNPTAMR